jgi:hypothetical protein
MDADDHSESLTPVERARIARRDRRRRTAMVVDNGGVKRVLQALSERRVARSPAPTDGDRGID